MSTSSGRQRRGLKGGGEAAQGAFDSIRRGRWMLTAKNLFLPIFCRQCGRRLLTEENGFFCPTCWELSPRIRRPFCSLCGRPHEAIVGFGPPVNFPCSVCRSEKRERHFRRVYGAARYDGAVADAIKLLKFYEKKRVARALGALMREFAYEELDRQAYDYVVPVPLHRVRERARGFNQARLLAQELACAFPDAVVDESLKRIRPTRVQSKAKNEAERKRNVQGAFAVVGGEHLRGARALLVDDVVTTGETISECARELRKADVSVVDVFATALAVRYLPRAGAGR